MTDRPNSRLKIARERAGFKTASAFAAKFGLTESTYRSTENGTRGLRIETAKQYAKLLGVSWQWLIDGDSQSGNPEPVFKPDEMIVNQNALADFFVSDMPRDMPILGTAACGDGEMFELNGDALDYARRPARLSGVKSAYALYITGDSMSPWREPGQLIYVHPVQPPTVGDYVVVQIDTGPNGPQRAYIKKLIRRTADNLRLAQYNPAKEITLPMKQVKSIHRIIDWSELMGL